MSPLLSCFTRALPFRSAPLVMLVLVSPVLSPRMFAAPPRYDHVVIVVEENRAPSQIIGDLVNAPYINSLANGGVKMGSMFASCPAKSGSGF